MTSNSHTESIYNFCRNKFESIQEECAKKKGTQLILSSFGEFSEKEVDSILVKIENKLEDYGARKGVIKRVFHIVVESLQNIRIHGTKDEFGKQTSYIILHKDNNFYRIDFANLADNSDVASIQKRLNRLDGLDAASLKEVYLDTLSKTEISEKGGAGLGFITIAMKSANNIKYSFDKIGTKLTLFTVEARVESK